METKQINGSTSSFIPGSTGDQGARATLTYVGTYMSAPSTFKPLMVSILEESVTIPNDYKVAPIKYDYIIYSKPNVSYILIINNVIETSTVYDVDADILATWNTKYDEDQEDVESVNLTFTAIPKSVKTRVASKALIFKTALSAHEYGFETPRHMNENLSQYAKILDETSPENYITTNSYCLGITVNEQNLTKHLGHYRIELEFVTDLSSPRMDGIIAEKFKKPTYYDKYNEKLTLRGYIGNYGGTTETIGNVQVGKFQNFDAEKLDNFVITIKDYSEGTDRNMLTKDLYIPKQVIEDAAEKGFPYKCYAYIYIDQLNGTIKKILIQDISDVINE